MEDNMRLVLFKNDFESRLNDLKESVNEKEPVDILRLKARFLTDLCVFMTRMEVLSNEECQELIGRIPEAYGFKGKDDGISPGNLSSLL